MHSTLLFLTAVLVTMFLVPIAQGAAAQEDESDNTGQKVLNFTQWAIQKLKDAGEKVESYIHNMTSDSNQTDENITSEIGSSNSSNTGNATMPLNETTML